MSTAKNTAKMVTDARLRALKPGETASDSVPGRGNGAILFERKPSGVVTATYRYMHGGKRHKLPMSNYKAGSRDAGLTLSQLRDEAKRLALIAQEHGDVATYLAEQEAEAQRQRIEHQRLAEIEASRGTLGELFLDYIEARRGKATPGVIKELERLYQANMLKPHPAILQMKARDIRPDHILAILDPIWSRGAKVQADRMRSFLVAAFNHGLRAENAVGRANAKRYSLESNPAAVVAVEKVSAPVERALSDAELRQFWTTIESTEGVGPVMALLFKFVIATGGQRIFNICQTTWDDYNLEAGTVRLVHRKGRKDAGAGASERPHLVPLSPRAVEILERVRAVNGCHPWPWTTTGKQHIVVSSPRHAVADWLASDHAGIDGKRITTFSPRDLRRTCAQLMQKHGVSDSLSDLLQAHGQTGVVGRHYRNNPEAALPEKRRAIELFDRALAMVLGEVVEQADNVVKLEKKKA
ncbi:tyrosine-type recombinase/integrase [Azotobacter chroococcum]|uniref:Phage integrase family protein n=1 Tax=Azotobacter chroococcum NCIMB 8003 TaxID=1328314 RepID=A0A0C4WKA9_9GAMM|nr:site-specific integrase [Azotobacter chroococcum]AJE23153.1 Phage integrase family protein [Azotobacter chroococcum NCIMB 8003]